MRETEEYRHHKMGNLQCEKHPPICRRFLDESVPFEKDKWASSWDYGTICPPKTHSSNAHAQPSSGATCRSLIFGRTLRLLPYFMCANSEGSGETARMRRLAWAFAGRLCGKYHNFMSWFKRRSENGARYMKNYLYFTAFQWDKCNWISLVNPSGKLLMTNIEHDYHLNL